SGPRPRDDALVVDVELIAGADARVAARERPAGDRPPLVDLDQDRAVRGPGCSPGQGADERAPVGPAAVPGGDAWRRSREVEDRRSDVDVRRRQAEAGGGGGAGQAPLHPGYT